VLDSIYYHIFVLLVCLLPSNCRNWISHCCRRATVSNQNISEVERFSSFDEGHDMPVIVLIHQMTAKCKSTFVMQYSVIWLQGSAALKLEASRFVCALWISHAYKLFQSACWYNCAYPPPPPTARPQWWPTNTTYNSLSDQQHSVTNIPRQIFYAEKSIRKTTGLRTDINVAHFSNYFLK